MNVHYTRHKHWGQQRCKVPALPFNHKTSFFRRDGLSLPGSRTGLLQRLPAVYILYTLATYEHAALRALSS